MGNELHTTNGIQRKQNLRRLIHIDIIKQGEHTNVKLSKCQLVNCTGEKIKTLKEVLPDGGSLPVQISKSYIVFCSFLMENETSIVGQIK